MAAFNGLIAISLGLGLAAASGFRVFLPPMLLSGAINVGLIEASGQLSLPPPPDLPASLPSWQPNLISIGYRQRTSGSSADCRPPY